MPRDRSFTIAAGWVILLFFSLAAGYPPDENQVKRIAGALDRFVYLYPQQKAYLHLDKHAYHAGDRMWIKAYLVNALNHHPDTLSTNLYVELISPAHTRVEIKRFQMFSGFGAGDFLLSDTLPEGLYQVRAYTKWMQNFDRDFFFTKNFQVSNRGYARLISPREARLNRRELDVRKKQTSDIDLQFLPEGGHLVGGLESVVAFRAANALGKGVEVSGTVYDDAGRAVAEFKSHHKGIGRFEFTPGRDRKYNALIQHEGKPLRVDLPEVQPEGIVMHVTENDNLLAVKLSATRKNTSDRSATQYLLVGQMGGKAYFFRAMQLDTGSATEEISKTGIPPGILHLTVFSSRSLPVAERLVMMNPSDHLRIRMDAYDSAATDGRRLVVALQVSDVHNQPVQANLSMALVHELEGGENRYPVNLVSHLLLSSDLKGTVEDPAGYFADRSPFMRQALDNLMLTHGWRRFNWTSMLNGEYPKIKFNEERGLTVAGQVTHDFFGIPLRNCRVELTILDSYNDVFTQQTGQKGFFKFENMAYYDTVNVKIEAWRPSGRRNLQILLEEELFHRISGFEGDYTLITDSERDKKIHRQQQAEEARIAYDEEQERLAEERKDELKGIYNEPDYVLRSEDFPKGSRDILEVMKGRVPGVLIQGDQITIRGVNSMFGSNQPLFLIDGVPTTDVYVLRAIPIEQIERVEVLKGPSAAIFGVRGGNGVIAVYTKRGQFMRRGVIEFDMLGYCKPARFYQPRYQTGNEPGHNHTVYWEPVIITDEKGRARIILDKPLVEGDYRFVIEGISYQGHAGSFNRLINNE